MLNIAQYLRSTIRFTLIFALSFLSKIKLYQNILFLQDYMQPKKGTKNKSYLMHSHIFNPIPRQKSKTIILLKMGNIIKIVPT